MKNIDLQDTLFVPDLCINLLFVGKIANRGYTIIFDKDSKFVRKDSKGFGVKDKDDDQVLTAKRMNGLYYVNPDGVEDCKASMEFERTTLL